MTTIIFETELKVRSYELDSFGHVNNANFLNYLEAARGDFLEKYGLSFDNFNEWKSWPVLASIKLDYHYPAFFADLLNIRVILKKMGKSSIIFDYEVLNQNEKMIITAETTLVFVNEKGKPMAIPTQYKDLFKES
ncbi:MAG: acyl-CoA thioesterase [Candidatus Marinimicrobia bacterium]|nr:acyl-CoA thioesterase [Candidatus Neomarinimicrobiota bacterium]